jgi:hypothetical protein
VNLGTPPKIEELVGPEPLMLDEEEVVRNFLGKTQEEMRESLTRPEGRWWTMEDFSYMQPPGLRYYLPPVFDYLKSEDSIGHWDDAYFLLGSLYCQVTIGNGVPPDLLAYVNQIAEYCDSHREKFGLDPQEDESSTYITAIREAWQNLKRS